MKIKKNSFYLGFERAYNVPLLPDKYSEFLNHVFTRIFRVIGGVCYILYITKFYLQFPSFLHKIILLLGILQIMQIIITMNIKLIYGVYTLIKKPGKFEVRNSP